MTIKKVATPTGLPRIHPGLEQRLREAERAELEGRTPKQLDDAQRVLRPSLDAREEGRAGQVHAIGLIEPAYRVGQDGVAALADQPAYKPGLDLDERWDQLTEQEKLRAGATERFRLEYEAALRRARGDFKEPHAIAGRLDARNIRRGHENLEAEAAAFGAQLALDARELLQRFLAETRELIELCVRQRVLRGVDARELYGIERDLLGKLVYQELSSRRRAMGDRGIRRIVANVTLGERLYAQCKRVASFSPRERLMMRVLHAHQDLGHTAYAARVSYRGGRLHRAYGTRIFHDEMDRYRAIFATEHLELLRGAVATHSSEELPIAESRVLAFGRAVDHLAPFAPYRVSRLFDGLAGVADYLDDMLARVKKGELERYVAVKALLAQHLAETLQLPLALREDLMASFRAFERLAEPVDLGAVCGEVAELQLDLRGAGTITATLAPDAFAARYQLLFDHQQDQFARLARTCGVKLDKAAPGETLTFSRPGMGALCVVVAQPG